MTRISEFYVIGTMAEEELIDTISSGRPVADMTFNEFFDDLGRIANELLSFMFRNNMTMYGRYTLLRRQMNTEFNRDWHYRTTAGDHYYFHEWRDNPDWTLREAITESWEERPCYQQVRIRHGQLIEEYRELTARPGDRLADERGGSMQQRRDRLMYYLVATNPAALATLRQLPREPRELGDLPQDLGLTDLEMYVTGYQTPWPADPPAAPPGPPPLPRYPIWSDTQGQYDALARDFGLVYETTDGDAWSATPTRWSGRAIAGRYAIRDQDDD